MNTPPNALELCRQLAELMRARVTADTILVGIHTGGAWVAEWLHRELNLKTPPGSVDAGYHRDDHHLGGGSLKSGGRASHLPFDVEGAHVVIVDDVLHTGRTIRAAMNEVFDYGRPAKIELAVLADRGGRELPIAPDYCALITTLPAGQILALSKGADGSLSFEVTGK